MFDINIPGFGARERETKTKEAASKTAAESPAMRARNEVKQALTEAFGRPVVDNDVYVAPVNGNRFRVLVSSGAVPPKPPLSLFGFTLPFQHRPRGSEIDAALANVNVGAKRRIFLGLFTKRAGTQYASTVFRDEESLMRFAVDCRLRLGNTPSPEEQAKKKSEAEAKTKTEANVKTAAVPSVPTGLPGGLGGLPGMPGGAPPSPMFGGPAAGPRLPEIPGAPTPTPGAGMPRP